MFKCALLKIAHDKYRTVKRQQAGLTNVQEMFHAARQGNAEISTLINSYSEILSPVRVLELFERIPTEVRCSKGEMKSENIVSRFPFRICRFC